ncbi:MAG: serine protease [Paracoccaceae bacterium]
MKKFIAALAVLVTAMVSMAQAQVGSEDIVFVQVEAHPSLQTARQRSQFFGNQLADVNGFSLGGGWYGIALGPYRRDDAQRVLQIYRSEGRIPNDAYIAEARAYGNQFYPVGANVLNRGTLVEPETTQQATATQPEAAPEPEPQPTDETPAEARRSERQLSAQERKDLQIALQWAGFYNSGIDGAFGPGTRRSMGDWQAANGYEVTGILTTVQRQILLDQYNAPLISVGLDTIADSRAGIQMPIPTKAVRFARYEAPFAQYDNTSGDGIRLLLISQPGDQRTLFGLYDIMQTLEIVPLDGPRERKDRSFVLEGRNSRFVSYTEAALDGGEIKGFTLIWPAGDEERRTRVLAAMRDGFERLDGVLDPAAGGDAVQNVDLVSGLAVRKPRLSRSGFFVDTAGTVVTTAEAVQNCTRITLDNTYRAELAATDNALGIAVLRPAENLAPQGVAQFRSSSPRLKSDVTVSGYSFEGKLGAPTLTFGKLEDVTGLRGETELTRLALNAEPGDAGGPVLDTGGAVLGMLLPRTQDGQQLPANVSFAANGLAIGQVLSNAGLAASAADATGIATPDDLLRDASNMTVLVSCWD